MTDTIDLTPSGAGKGAASGSPARPAGPPAEAAKARLLRKATAFAEEILDPGERESAGRVIAEIYRHVPPADVAGRTARALGGAALSLWRFAARRRPGRAKIRVYNPEPDLDGWASPHTVVELANDDMPFLVDSVTAAINSADRVVHLAIHPILTLDRDARGHLQEIGGNDPAALRESWMQIEITRDCDPAELARLTEGLSRVLADVRSAVTDWQAMRETLRAVLDDLTRPPAAPVARRELAEAEDFLRWLDDDNFTFLGYRDYLFNTASAATRPALGILADPNYRIFDGLRELSSLPADVQNFIRRPELLVVTKSNRRATVHRTAHMDAIGVRRFGADGGVIGLHLFLGLFTSLAYSANPRAIPLLRLKVRHIVDRSGLSPLSHDGKALAHILDTLPRDELFQGGEDELFDTVIGILNLQERQRIALFVRRDPMERFVSCIVFAPRDRYDTALRQRFAAILERAFAGELATFYTHLDDSMLARVQYIIRTTRGAVPAVDTTALEDELAEAGRNWADHFEDAAIAAFGEAESRLRLQRLKPFPVAYQALTSPSQALADLPRLEKVLAGSPLEVSLHPIAEGTGRALRIYRGREPVALSDILPILENLGLRIVAEEPFRIENIDAEAVWVHEFELAGAHLAGVAERVRRRFEDALAVVWAGRVENDRFNRLVLTAGLSVRQVSVLRLYAKVLRQSAIPFSQAYMEEALGAHPEIAAGLFKLFDLRFDPAGPGDRERQSKKATLAIEGALDAVASLDEDRILRGFLTLVGKTLRTNYFQRLPSGEPKPYIAVKLASSEIDLLPAPRPLFEIYVHSPRMEGVHMRAGKVARGGIRWSDRREDFRAEILGLMKAQTVKNAVIIPVGAKGGFVIKQPPAARDQLAAEAVECYKILIRGLLDLTDNIVPGDGAAGHRIAPPPNVVRHDADDPYLVVAADKGTATFSDYANAISQEYGFWLGDAFASGGSAGYDHKVMGITARGAWESVKRHFRELGRDIETSDVTVIGVGDMSGDVFGNGMLMSRHLRLLGAFDHRHVFVDPDPDPERSYAERRRLFDRPRSSWADYDAALISAGGGVFERTVKSITISPRMKQLFGTEADHLTPAELIREMLVAPVDLLWFGGIGTFVKACEESHTDVGDRANDALRIDAGEIRAKVIGEGANLGVTQRARIAFALAGGRIDTDAIDNSAGVDTSDHEVNLKILIDRATATGALPAAEREPLLHVMTGEVAALVLRDNYLQGQALSIAEARGPGALDRQVRLMRDLEKSGRLDRALEFLPDEEAVADRAAHGRGLTRPELAVLLAYAKMALDVELLDGELPDSPAFADELRGYFPSALRERLGPQIPSHPLRRELVATILSNDLVNRAGLTFISDLRARTGRPTADIVRAYRIVREAFDLPPLWAEIEALDNRVPARVQTEMLLEIAAIVEHAAARLLRVAKLDLAEGARLMPGVRLLSETAPELLPPDERALFDERGAQFAAAGIPAPLATRAAGVIFLTTALEVCELAAGTAQPVTAAARIFYQIGARLGFDRLRDATRRLPAATAAQRAAVVALIDDFYGLQADLAERLLREPGATGAGLDAWLTAHPGELATTEAVAADLRAAGAPDLAMLVVAARQLRQMLG